MPRHVDWHDDWIIENYLHYESYEKMVTDYNRLFNDHVTKPGLSNHCRLKLGIHKPRVNNRHYTQEQIEWLTEHLPKLGRKETCRLFNETFNETRTVRAMKSFTNMYGVKVNEDVWKAHVAWNLNHDKIKPIGTERIDHGYPMIKVGNCDWRQKNRLVYEAEHGAIPKGYCVVHLDNNPLNCDINNLRIVRRDLLSAIIVADWKSDIPQITESSILWMELNELLGRNKL